MSSIIKLSFHNESELQETPKIVLYQKYMIGGELMRPVAWKVLQNVDRGFYHAFQFEEVPNVQVKNAEGVQINGSGDLTFKESYLARPHVQDSGFAIAPLTLPLINGYPKGIIKVEMSKGGNSLITPFDMNPMTSYVFQFDHLLWVGPTITDKEGHLINEDETLSPHTGLSMKGIKQAEIVMSGGDGLGEKPLTFSLRNIS